MLQEEKQMANIIDGKAVSAQVKEGIRQEVEALKANGIEIGLAVVIVGDDPASQVYVKNKEKACEAVGFNSYKYALPAETTEEELLALVDKLNNDDKVDGILVQLPALHTCGRYGTDKVNRYRCCGQGVRCYRQKQYSWQATGNAAAAPERHCYYHTFKDQEP